MVKLTPKCLSGKGYGYSAQGYIVPCCWCDPRETHQNRQVSNEAKEIKDMFFKEHLKLTNVDSINEILKSEEWKGFYDALIDNNGDNALEVCKRYCGTTQSTKLKEEFKSKLEEQDNGLRSYDHSTGIKVRFRG
jgi:hypothetical protein